MTNSFATFNIPVSPHVKKFLNAYVGKKYMVSQDDFLGMMITPMLSKKQYIHRGVYTDSKKTVSYPISISYEYFEKQGCFLSFEQHRLIGRMLDKYFRDMLYNHVMIYIAKHPGSQKKAIINFCESFGITVEDIDPETLYKDFQRKKTKRMSQVAAKV